MNDDIKIIENTTCESRYGSRYGSECRSGFGEGDVSLSEEKLYLFQILRYEINKEKNIRKIK